jgi:acetoin utilization deacetylase AcuC-like enzyme
VKLFYTDHFELPLPTGHRFPMAKYYRLRQYLGRCDWCKDCQFLVPPAATDTELMAVHTQEYVRRVADGLLEPLELRRIGFPWSRKMVERSRRSVGATLAAARVALHEGIAVNLAGGTHHAYADSGQGYCVFNDVAVTARVMQQEAGLRRVLIADLDVHQGNGTAAIFADDPSVFTFSMHSEKNYPFRKHQADLDVALPDGTGDVEYLDQLDQRLDEALAASHADLVLYISGADPFEGDRLGRLKLSKPGILARDRMLMTRCRDRGLPVVVTMGGGYAVNLDDIVEIHANTVYAAWLQTSGVGA